MPETNQDQQAKGRREMNAKLIIIVVIAVAAVVGMYIVGKKMDGTDTK